MPATYEPIATTTLGSAASSITFSSISSAYTDLRVIFTGVTSSNTIMYTQVNGDTGANYSRTYLGGNGSVATSGRDTNATRWQFHDSTTTSTSLPMMGELNIFSYSGSTYKTALTAFSGDENGSGDVYRNAVLWRNTAAITSITIYPGAGNLNTGFTATIWGIKAA